MVIRLPEVRLLCLGCREVRDAAGAKGRAVLLPDVPVVLGRRAEGQVARGADARAGGHDGFLSVVLLLESE